MNIVKQPIYASKIWFVLIYLFINDLFLLKYVPYTGAKIFAISCYSVLIPLLLSQRLQSRLSSFFLFVSRYWWIGAISLTLFIYLYVSPFSVTPDRWSALYYWSENLLHGSYPYLARTHMGGYGSPFPIWQLLHLPFYLLGDEIFAHIVVQVLLVFFLRRNSQFFSTNIFVLLLMLSPAYWWEVLVRSDLLNNLMCCMMLIVLMDKYRQKWESKPFLTAFVIGLCCCTRIFLIIPFWIYFTPLLVKQSWKNIGMWSIGFLVGFLLPFFPFLIWNADMLLHFRYSPIILQIRQGSLLTFGIGLIMISVVSFIWKKTYQYFIVTTLALFGFIVMMFIRKCYYEGVNNSIFQDAFDLSYFDIVLPFLLILLSFKNKDIDFKFLTNKTQ